MKHFLASFLVIIVNLVFLGCKNDCKTSETSTIVPKNTIHYAKGLAIFRYENYSVVTVKNPYPGANQSFTYVLKKYNANIPDSLKTKTIIPVPIQSIVATSTTYLASLEMLHQENTLVGFPNLNLISSENIRFNIDQGKVAELGNNQSLNFEKTLELNPSVIVMGIEGNNNATLTKFNRGGLPVMINGDWNEQTPLGKAEWIKFFGALYGKENEANVLFDSVVKEYQSVSKLVQNTTSPTVLVGSLYEQTWYVPQGESWGAIFLKDAGGNYLWRNEKGTGGLPLSFEKVFDTAQNADFWIGPGQFNSLQEMKAANPHYAQFKAFKTKQVYSYSLKKGKTGGLIYFEEAANRPDLVLKDLIKILHPELLPDYTLYFFQKLN